MNYRKFFALAKEAGIDQCQLYVSKAHSLRFKLFHRELESYTVADTQAVTVSAIYQGKFVTVSTQKLDRNTFAYLINEIIARAKINEKPAEVDLFKGSKKYRRGYFYNEKLLSIPAQKKVALLRRLENAIYEASPLVTDADHVSFGESSYEAVMMNSYGLRLLSKGNSYSFSAGAIVRQDEETKTYFDVHVDNELSSFNPEAFAKHLVDEALRKLGGTSIKTGRYPTVIDREIMSSLIGMLLDATSADDVRRHSSFLEGKLGQLIASKKLTVVENPYAKNLNYYYFDDEGVAATKKTIIKNGVLQTYLHNRETAKHFGCETTGNAQIGGSRMRVGYNNVFVKPGKQTFNEMISSIKNGVYITEVAGLGSGLNENSGDFSCQAEGYRIIDGKISEPLSLITLSGNILTLFEDLKCFDCEAKLMPSGFTVSNAFIKKMNIGGL